MESRRRDGVQTAILGRPPRGEGRRRAAAGLLPGLAAVLLLAGALPAQASPPPGKDAPKPARIELGQAAPDFSLESVDGATYRLSDLRGKSNLVLVFFRGTW